MQVPRLQFTVRRLMIAVAVLALALFVVIPLLDRLLWIYHAPLSINLVRGEIEPSWIVLENRPPVHHPVLIQCSYQTRIGSTVPSGLPYKVLIEVKLTDPGGPSLGSTGRPATFLRAANRAWMYAEN